MADLLLLYPDRASLPRLIGASHDVTELAFAEIRLLREIVARLERALFGQSSERMKKQSSDKTATTEAAVPVESTDETQSQIEVPAHKRRKPSNRNKDNYQHHGRNPFPDHLPRERVEYDLDPHDKTCPQCCTTLTKIGEEVTEKLGIIPLKFFVWAYVRFKYACRGCRRYVTIAEMPKQPLHKGSMSAEALAYMAMSKYEDFLPLYRIQRQFARQGLFISRSTYADQEGHVARLFEPIYNAMVEGQLKRNHLFVDATTMPFLDPGLGKTRTGSMWIIAGKEGREQKAVATYHFAPNKGGKHLLEFLKGFKGYIQTDRDPIYDALIKPDKKNPNKVPPCKQVACLAHVRRKFVDTVTYHEESIAQEALACIGRLYDVERLMSEERMDDEQRYRYRLKHSKSQLDTLDLWIKNNREKATPKSLLGKAMTYASNAFLYLYTFLEKGYLEIDNNRAERAMKPPVLLRKNSLFAGSIEGGKTMAM